MAHTNESPPSSDPTRYLTTPPHYPEDSPDLPRAPATWPAIAPSTSPHPAPTPSRDRLAPKSAFASASTSLDRRSRRRDARDRARANEGSVNTSRAASHDVRARRRRADGRRGRTTGRRDATRNETKRARIGGLGNRRATGRLTTVTRIRADADARGLLARRTRAQRTDARTVREGTRTVRLKRRETR